MKTIIVFFNLIMVSLLINGQQVRHPFYFNQPIQEYNAGNFLLKNGEVLDSIVGYTPHDSAFWSEFVYKYDCQGNRSEISYYSYNTYDPETMKSIRLLLTNYEYGYDAKGNMNLSLVKLPDEPYVMKTVYFYNSKDQLSTELYSRTFDSITWDDEGKLEILYDKFGNVESELRTALNEDSMITKYLYDTTTNKLQEVSSLGKKEQKWVPYGKTKYKYDANGFYSNISVYQIKDSILTLNREIIYLYVDTTLSEIESISYTPDGNQECWKKIFIKNGNERKLIEKKKTNGEWVNFNQIVSLLDENGRETEHEEFSWNNSKWMPYYKFSHRFENDRLSCEIFYALVDQEWTVNEKRYFFYSPLSVSNKIYSSAKSDDLTPRIQVLPGLLMIENLKEPSVFELYSVDGKLLIQKQLQNQISTINTNEYNGVFILRMNRFSQKIILK